eukprot:5698716-Pleurochrysis_carterae.AAC.2
MAAWPYMNTCPDVECCVAQSESENPASGRLLARAYRNPTERWRDRHGATQHTHRVRDVRSGLGCAVE